MKFLGRQEMIEINPFAELSSTVSVEVMQGFVTIMIALVALQQGQSLSLQNLA